MLLVGVFMSVVCCLSFSYVLVNVRPLVVLVSIDIQTEMTADMAVLTKSYVYYTL